MSLWFGSGSARQRPAANTLAATVPVTHLCGRRPDVVAGPGELYLQHRDLVRAAPDELQPMRVKPVTCGAARRSLTKHC